MSQKRRYYREDRKRPEYLEEDDDWEDDEGGSGDIDGSVRKTSWGLLAVLSFGVLLSIAQTLYVPSGPLPSGDAYRVVSVVSRGRLQAEKIGTGRVVNLDDQKLVRAALDGTIKAVTSSIGNGVMQRYISSAGSCGLLSVCSVLNDV